MQKKKYRVVKKFVSASNFLVEVDIFFSLNLVLRLKNYVVFLSSLVHSSKLRTNNNGVT